MKKIISVISIMTLLFSFTFTIFAQNQVRFNVGNKSVVNNKEISENKKGISHQGSRDSQDSISPTAEKPQDKALIPANHSNFMAADKVPAQALRGLEKNSVISNKGTDQEMQRVLIVFKDRVDKAIVDQSKGKIKREYNNISALAIEIPVVAVKGLQNNPNIAFIEEDYIVSVSAQKQDWGITRTEAPKAWELHYTGKDIKIAVVDTGIASHEDLSISGGAAFTSYTASYVDDNGHGTHVAGIIGAKNNSFGTVGIAPDSSLYAVKVLGKDGSGYLSDVVAGIDWSISNKMDIVNLSLGSTSSSSTLKQVVDKAYSQGILVVAAAGNIGTVDGIGDNVTYPARYDSVIAVAATDANDKRASFSSTGNTVEVAAPGVQIISTYLNNQYAYMNGTSMATPYVAGNIALLKQAYPTLSNTELRNKLQETVIDLGSVGIDSWFGYGFIQAPKEQKAISEPIISQPQVLETKTIISTDKSSYVAGEKVYIKANVTDYDGKIIAGAQVKFTITPPKGKKVMSSGKTDSTGQITLVFSTTHKSTKGTYQVLAEATFSDYQSSKASTTFQVK
jgi:minor extracellular protease Epr